MTDSLGALRSHKGDHSELQNNEESDLDELLLNAARVGDIEQVKRCLQQGADIEARDFFDSTPLQIAVQYDHNELFSLLVRRGAHIRTNDYYGDTPLHTAISRSNGKVSKLLLKGGAGVNAKNSQGETPLHLAVSFGSQEMVELLLKEKAEVNAKNNEGETPLYQAVVSQNEEIVKLLVGGEADVNTKNNKGWTPLLQATVHNCTGIAEILLENEATIGASDDEGDQELHNAALNGNFRLATLLLAKGAEIGATNESGVTAFHSAAESGNVEIAQALLDKGAEVNMRDSSGHTALHYAAGCGRTEMVELLLKKMSQEIVATKNEGGETALSLAADGRQKAIVQLLVNSQPNLTPDSEFNLETTERTNPRLVESIGALLLENENLWTNSPSTWLKTMHWAALNGHEQLTKKLLPRIREGQDKRQVLFLAAAGGQESIIKSLIEQCKKNGLLSKEDGIDAVKAAAKNGHEKIVEQLLRNMMEPEPTGGGAIQRATWTPLHWAINYGEMEAVDVVRYLLINGANPEATITEGKRTISAMEMAMDLKERGKIDVAILGLLETPLRFPRKPLQLTAPKANSEILEDICKQFRSNIIDFYPSDGHFYTVERKSVVLDILYRGGPEETMSQATKTWNMRLDQQHRFRWIHLPANNWIWVEDLMRRVSYESKKSDHEYTKLKNFVERNRREYFGKVQCRFMYPSLSSESKDFHSGEGPSIAKLQRKEEDQAGNNMRKSSTHHIQGMSAAINALDDKKGPLGRSAKRMATQLADHRTSIWENVEVDESKVQDNTASIVGARAQTIVDEPILDAEIRGITADKSKANEASGAEAMEEDVKVAIGELKDHPRKLLQQGEGQRQPGEQLKSEKLRRGMKEKAQDESSLSHLEGCKLALCIPYLTFDTVEGQRKLRQSIRLAEEAHQVSVGSMNHQGSLSPENHLESAKMNILAEEIAEGKRLLKGIIKASEKLNLMPSRSKKLQKLHVILESAEEKIGIDLKKGLGSLKDGLKDLNGLNTPSDILAWRERLQDAIEFIQQKGPLKHEGLLHQYLRPGEPKGLHVSRTLDQYYYSSLSDTNRRDIDQVVRRYQNKLFSQAQEKEKHRKSAKRKSKNPRVISMKRKEPNPSTFQRFLAKERSGNANNDGFDSDGRPDDQHQMCMVDQLWLWIIDDNTIITCFPQSSGQDTTKHRVPELLNKICSHIHDDMHPQIPSVYHLATLIASICIGFVDDCQVQLPNGPESLLRMFASSIGIVADEEVKCFEAFKREGDRSEEDGHINTGSTQELDIREEIKLLEEVKDISDELNILQSICEDQKDLLQKLFNLVAKPHPDSEGYRVIKEPVLNYYQDRSNIQLRIETIKKMQMDARTTYVSLNHLLDLKQKNANIMEAIQARKEAEETTKQGRTILVFTIVTIIFLPLSFLASLFALNVESFPHASGNLSYQPTWIFSRIFGTTAAFAIPLVVVAIYINDFLKLFERTDSSEKGSTETSQEHRPSFLHSTSMEDDTPVSMDQDGWRQPRSRFSLPSRKAFGREKSLSQTESQLECGEA